MLNKLFNSQQILFLFISNITNALMYVLQAYLARHLDTSDFGIFNAINSYSMTVLVFASLIPFLVSKEMIKRDKASSESFFNSMASYSVLLGLILIATLTSLLYFVRQSLRLDSYYELVVINIITGESILFSVLAGCIQGQGKFVALSLTTCAQALLRLVLTVLFISVFKLTVMGVILPIFITYTMAIFCLLYVANPGLRFSRHLRSLVPARVSRIVLASKIRLFFSIISQNANIVVMLLVIGILSNIDVWIVKSYFPPEQAGLYSGASLTGKIGFFAVSSLTSVLYPQILKSKGQTRGIMLSALLITLGISASYVLMLYFFGDQFIGLLWGRNFSEIRYYALITSSFMCLLATLNIVFTFMTASSGFRGFWINLVAVLITFALIRIRLHESIMQISLTFLISTALLLFFNVAYLFVFRMRDSESLRPMEAG